MAKANLAGNCNLYNSKSRSSEEIRIVGIKASSPAHGPMMIFTCSTLLVIYINLNLVPLHSPRAGSRFLRGIRGTPLLRWRKATCVDRAGIFQRILGTIFCTLYGACTAICSAFSWKEITYQRIDLIHLQKISICKRLTICYVRINDSGETRSPVLRLQSEHRYIWVHKGIMCTTCLALLCFSLSCSHYN